MLFHDLTTIHLILGVAKLYIEFYLPLLQTELKSKLR